MAILSTGNLLSEQRYDISDARRVESAVRNDFDTTVTSIFTNTSQGYIIRGFSIVVSGAIGSAANGLQMVVDPGAILNIDASVSGTIFQTPLGTPNQVLNAATNPNVSGSFTANSTNYVGIDYNRFADNTTNVTKYIWNASSNDEITTIAPAAQTLTFVVVITTSVWAANVAPVAEVVTDSNGNVISVSDCRWMIYSLETGGLNPNPEYVYPWAEGRTQPPVTTTSNSVDPFNGGDKQLDCFKSWADAIMTTLLEIKGTPFWFTGSSGGGPIPTILSLFQDLGNTVTTGSGSIAHGVSPVDKKTPTSPGQINWDQNIDIRVVGSSLTYVLTANPTSTDILLSDDEVCYVTLVRGVAITPNLIFTAGSPVVTSVGAVTWTSGLLPGDFIKVATDTVAGYYQILTVDSGSQVTLTTNVMAGDNSGPGGVQAQYAFGSYQASPTPTTNRNLYISSRETVPQGANVFWLFMREDNGGAPRAYIRFLGAELDDGEDREIDGSTSAELLLYIGAPSQSSFAPAYVSAYSVYEGDSSSVLPEITQITTGAGSTVTTGQYFLINSSANAREYVVWFKVNGSGTAPVVPNTNDIIEVDILSADSADTVATKLASAMNDLLPFDDFTAIAASNVVTVTNNSSGTCNAASNGNVSAPFSISTTQVGTGPGNYVINDGDDLTLAIKKLDNAVGNIEASLDSPTYDEVVEIVASGATPPTSLNGPIVSGTDITLPNNSREGNVPQQYTVGKGTLQVFLNGQFLDVESGAYSEVGTAGTPSSQIEILIGLVVGDELEFRLGGGGGGGGGGGVGPAGPPGPTGPTGPAGMNSAGGPVAVSIKTGNYSILSTDCFLAADCTSGNIIFTLPPSSGNTGRIFYCKKIDASANTLTIIGSGGDIIDQSSSFILSVQDQSASLIANGSTGYWVF